MILKEISKISKTLKLLYVEDDDVARSSTLEMLENFFIDITVAVDGEDGLQKFNDNNFDIILSDINMPKLNGIGMLKAIRDVDKDISILFLSAHNEASYMLDSIRYGVDGYILKPLEIEQFTYTLKKIVDKIILMRESKHYKEYLEFEVKQRTRELDKKLHFDELTGLYNIYSFNEDIKNITAPILLIVDINKFKIINEIYGTAIGSLVLKEFAKFLLEFTNDTTYKLYRLSGDEFIFFDDIKEIDLDKYEHDVERFFTKLNDFKVDIGDDFISLDVTLGISTSQEDAFESAKIALEYAKLNKISYAIYSNDIDKRKEEQGALEWKNTIKSSIENNRITPVYQPIVDMDGNIVKYETLMRLIEVDTGKLISPFFFLDIAIKTGLYPKLSSFVIFNALELLNSTSHIFSFNLTYGDIKNISFINEIDIFFKTSSEVAKRVIFEITESEDIENYDDVKEFINHFRKYGVKFAVDDFGSGFSNFEYILEIEPDYLKIDGSLIKDIDTDKKAHILVEAIVEFSHKLNIKVIAEYVHSQVIFEMLKKMGVDEYQGYYFSEPMENVK